MQNEIVVSGLSFNDEWRDKLVELGSKGRDLTQQSRLTTIGNDQIAAEYDTPIRKQEKQTTKTYNTEATENMRKQDREKQGPTEKYRESYT